MKTCGRAVFLSLIILLFSLPGLAAAEIILRSSLEPEQVWVGQRVLLRLDVLVTEGWAQLGKISEVQLEGAYVLPSKGQGTRLRETIDGDFYSGQRYELSLFPQRAGRFVVPEIQVEVVSKPFGFNAEETVAKATVPGSVFESQMPPGAESIQGLISTSSFSVQQRWSGKTEDLVVGDALERTITLQAENLPAMAFAPLVFQAIDGVGVYPGEAVVRDSSDRGSLSGTRVESLTYVLERPGEVDLPAIELTWWDIAQQELKTELLSGLNLQVAANPDLVSVQAPDVENGLRKSFVWVFLVLFLGGGLLIVYRPVSAILKTRQEARAESETTYFNMLLAAIENRDSALVLTRLMRWLDKVETEGSPARLDKFLGQYGERSQQELIEKIVRDLTLNEAGWQASELKACLTSARACWKKAQRQKALVKQHLPELNG